MTAPVPLTSIGTPGYPASSTSEAIRIRGFLVSVCFGKLLLAAGSDLSVEP